MFHRVFISLIKLYKHLSRNDFWSWNFVSQRIWYNIHTYTRTHIRAHAHAYTCMHPHTCTQTHTHTLSADSNRIMGENYLVIGNIIAVNSQVHYSFHQRTLYTTPVHHHTRNITNHPPTQQHMSLIMCYMLGLDGVQSVMYWTLAIATKMSKLKMATLPGSDY